MSKTLTREVWNELRYPVSLRQMPENEGSYWLAGIPMLGEGLFIADGETPQEALDALEERRRRFYDIVIESGKPIPLPTDAAEKIELPSGKWLQRTSPQIHAELKDAAKRHNVSFNDYCNQCLQRGHTIQTIEKATEQTVATIQLLAEQILEEVVASTTGRMELPTLTLPYEIPATLRLTGTEPRAAVRKSRTKKVVPDQ